MASPAPGGQLGPYELIAKIGEGGMGQVWRARDPRLQRDVAVKISKEQFSERFEREARAIGTLNHPHVCQIYDVGPNWLVMEYIEGHALKGPLPREKAFEYAIQMCEALDAAHRKGIVHRDLKPGNILVNKSGVKLLDFGLAKLTGTGPATEGITETIDITRANEVLGTLQYMSPEQLEGKPVDQRSDLFSLGIVLYELLAGKRPFVAETTAGMINKILTARPPPISAVQPSVPVALEAAISVCLEKDPEDRWQSARELGHALKWLQAGLPSSGAAAPRRAGMGWLRHAAVIATSLLIGAGLVYWLKPGYSPPITIDQMTYSGRDSSPAASPDGSTVVFSSARDGHSRIWLKQLKGGAEVALTSGPDDWPRMSPDGATILFSRNEGAHRSLYRVASVGGEPRKIVDDALSGDFSPDGRRIAFIRWKRENQRQKSVIGVSAVDGSNAVQLTELPDVQLNWPRWSPDGSEIAAIGAASLLSGVYTQVWVIPTANGQFRRLTASGQERGISSVAWSNSRTIVYAHGDRTVPVDTELIVHDTRADTVRRIPWMCCGLTVDIAGAGKVVFETQATRSGLIELGRSDRAQRWITHGNSADRQPVFSPDGRRIAFTSNRDGHLSLWQVSLDSGTISRVTEGNAADEDPAFSPDGTRLIFTSERTGHFEIYIANADGSGATQVTHDGVDAENATMTADGKWLVYSSAHPEKFGIWKIHPDGSGATRLLQTGAGNPEVSPDGLYVLYISSPRPDLAEIRVLRVSDGSEVPVRIECPILKQNGMAIGRARWVSPGAASAPFAIAFIGQDSEGSTGVYLQDFVPGRDTSSTRRQLRPFDPIAPVETLGVSPDGRRLIVSVADDTSSIMLASSVPGIKGRTTGPR